MGRLRGLLRPATLAAIAGVAAWLWAAHLLWDSTSLPVSDLPHLDPHRYFSSHFLDRSAGYERFLAILGLLSSLTLVAVLVVYARRGHRLVRESAAGRIGTGLLLAMLGFAVVWLAEAPFDLVAVWWQRRYGVSHEGYLPHLLASFLGLGSTFVFVCLGFAIMMGLAGVMRRWWWLVATPVFVGLGLLSTFVSPYLIPDTSPVHDPQLVAEAKALERIEGSGSARLQEQEVHRFTTAPNAESTGLGPSRTVILWDTLLHDGFDRAEIRFVLAHEVGHLANQDPLKRLGWLALYLLPALGLAALLTRRRGGLAQPEAIPIALLVLVVVQLLATPLFNIATRRQEAAADWAALEATREPATGKAVMRKLATKSLSDPDPPSWVYALYEDHPTIMQRIAMAEAWKTQRP
ncbi:MAG TPA: M48 family metalloprotease [Solirubrobacterales bacterium]|nr:M48 family metalloprotease [Solirubrobacterales bacterium]